MHKIKYLFLCLMILNLSCVKDTTNRDFKELNKISISGINDTYNVKVDSYLKIEPKITSFLNDESQLQYIWYKYNVASSKSRDTISFEKNLNYLVNDVPPGVKYNLVLKVIDKKTGIFTMKLSHLYSSSTYSKGFVAIVKDEGKIDLDFIFDESKEVAKKLYSQVNDGQQLSSTSEKVYVMNYLPTNAAGVYKNIFISTKDKDGLAILDPDLFIKRQNLLDLFFFKPEVSDVYHMSDVTNGEGAEFMILNNKLYDRAFNRNNIVASQYTSYAVVNKVPYDYELSPIIYNAGGSYGTPIVYDRAGRRFLRLQSNETTFVGFSKSGDNFIHFDPNTLPEMKDLIAGGIVKDYNNLWAIMKDDADKLHLLTMYDGTVNWDSKFNTTGKDEISLSAAPMLYKAKEILSIAHTEVGTYPYGFKLRGIPGFALYVVDNKVYAFDVTSKSEFMILDGNAQNLTLDRVLYHSVKELNSEDKEVWNTRISLCVKDNSLTGKKGGIVSYSVSFIGGVSLELLSKNTGFCDEVIHFDYKAD